LNQTQTNPKNDRLKREYLIELKEAYQRSETTIEQVRHAIDRLETYMEFKDFGTFNREQAIAFKRALIQTKGQRTGKPISISTAHHIIQAIKEFLLWLRLRPGYSRRITPADIAYLNLTTKEERAAHAPSPKAYATVEQFHAALLAMPTHTETNRRDQALMATILLTGMRDSAAVTLKLKHVAIERNYVFQDPREVKTKFSKAIETVFFPVGDNVVRILHGWVQYLRTEKLFGPDDPIFPKTAMQPDQFGGFAIQGLSREHWSNATPVRKIFQDAFARVGLPYFRPHSVRNTLTQLGYQLRLSGEQWKAWSQNMGHDSVLTTMFSYGPVSMERQAELISAIGLKGPNTPQANTSHNDEWEDRVAQKVAKIVLQHPLRA
jgi:integrase